MANDEFVSLAVIGAPHGVRGQVKLKSFTDPADGIIAYDSLQLADGTPIKLKLEGHIQDQLIVSIAGISDRTTVERWRGKELGVPRNSLPKLENDKQFYQRDLIGMQVVDSSGKPCGTVKNIANFGAGDLLEIEHEGQTEYYTFTTATFPHIDQKSRTIEFHPPEILTAGKTK